MEWIRFNSIALLSLGSWGLGLILLNLNQRRRLFAGLATALIGLGILLLGGFILHLWLALERPPMRTLGETRLWYSFFLPLVGLVTYLRWKYRWFMAYALAMAALFLIINILKPEIHSKTLMPALQSPWFVPHVIVYIFSYALLAASSLVAVKGLYQHYHRQLPRETLRLADNLVYIGFSFLTLGLLFGALWAKEAWGHYWTWDPKETWAFLTWLSYLLYLHFRHFQPRRIKAPLWALSLAFVILLICWFGVNYLPAAAESVHVYSEWATGIPPGGSLRG